MREAYLSKQPLDLEASAVDLERRGSWETIQAVPEGIHKIKEYL